MMTKELRLLMHLNCSMCDRTTGSSPNPQDFLHTMGKNAELLEIYPMIKREVMTEKKKSLFNYTTITPHRALVCINFQRT